MNLLTILFVVFLTLKLTGYIAWPWWWVASPLWILLLAYVVMAAVGAFAYGAKSRTHNER